MAVGVGLKDGHDQRLADLGLDGAEVMGQLFQIDFEIGGPRGSPRANGGVVAGLHGEDCIRRGSARENLTSACP